MEEAIKKANMGGYNGLYPVAPHSSPSGVTFNESRCGNCFCTVQTLHSHHQNDERVLLDPLFWQALGKAEGWSMDKIGVCGRCGGRGPRECRCDLYFEPSDVIDEWLFHWHNLIDHLASGGTPDEYFKKLLKN